MCVSLECGSPKFGRRTAAGQHQNGTLPCPPPRPDKFSQHFYHYFCQLRSGLGILFAKVSGVLMISWLSSRGSPFSKVCQIPAEILTYPHGR